MSKTSAIALLTDFGLQDGYVGILKGVISCINSHIPIVDLTHQIPPQHIPAGRFCLMNAYPYFPEGTVYVAVVDPGVGSQRRGVAIQFARGYLVGPDNGLFSGILSQSPAIAAVALTNPRYWRVPDPSRTFHGRDIFASVGGHLANGVPLSALGQPIRLESLVELPLQKVQITDTNIKGYIQYIDHFGNLITNIPAKLVQGKNWSIVVDKKIIQKRLTYSEVEPGELLTLIGSHHWIEISVNGGNAQKQLRMQWGDTIIVVFD